MNIAVIIPSRTLGNLVPCLKAIRDNDPAVDPRVVWDASHHDEIPMEILSILNSIGGGVLYEDFVFARNVNFGINNSGIRDGYILLNDDALVQTPSGFSLLAQAAKEHPEYGIVAATTNVVGNINQRPQGIGLREEPRMVCFVCVYIPRSTIETVGLLDERFGIGGFEDDDYCLRVRRAGLKIGIHDGVFVDHGSLVSTIRGPGGPGYNPRGAEIFRDKWGAGNHEV